MPGALLVYALCGLSGILLERCLVVNNLLKRTVLVLGIGAAQLMFSIELLSIWSGLTALSLITANVIISAITLGVARRKPSGTGRISTQELAGRSLAELRTAPKDFTSIALLVASGGLFAVASASGWIMVPFNDSYHFEMPRFWIQHHTVLPFPVHNPRIVTLSFLSEALQLPGYLYAHLDKTPAIFTVLWGLLTLWVIYSLARRIGASIAASICAAAVAVGYTDFALDTFHSAAEMFLAGVFFGTSILFLMDAHAEKTYGAFPTADLGCSVFLFGMSCGAKNSTALLAPLFLMFLAIVCKARFAQASAILPSEFGNKPSQSEERAIESGGRSNGPFASLATKMSVVILVGGIALLCSGVVWNYTSNKLWFREHGLPKLISDTVAKDFHPRAIWTRVCRGAVLMAYDTIWIPKGAKPKYVAFCEGTVKLLGGKQQIPEDNEYYSFRQSSITPLKGLGLLGMACLIPGLILACVRGLSNVRSGTKPISAPALNGLALVVLAIGAFVMCHLMLRWQSIGLLRLMFPFVIAAAPLAAVLLEKRSVRALALGLTLISGMMFFTLWMGHVSRRMGWTDRPSFKLISRLQNNHSSLVRYQWKGQSGCELQMNEDYTYREIYETLLKNLRQPCTIGFVGHGNSECLFLFGKQSQNRVIPMVDARADDQILNPTEDLDYVVAADKFSETTNWAQDNGFEQVFTSTNETGEMVMAFKKKVTANRQDR